MTAPIPRRKLLSPAKRPLGLLLALLLLVAMLTARRGAAAPAPLSAADSAAQSASQPLAQAPNGGQDCADPGSLPNEIERDTFCVQYTDGTGDALATNIADYTQAYWDRFVDD